MELGTTVSIDGANLKLLNGELQLNANDSTTTVVVSVL